MATLQTLQNPDVSPEARKLLRAAVESLTQTGEKSQGQVVREAGP